MSKKRTGDFGEHIAVEYLRGKGYSVVTTNWRWPRGELDIIARDGDTLVFVEVKTRRSADIGDAFSNITPRKRERLIASAYAYLASHHPENPPDWRIDAVCIGLPSSSQLVIEHVEDVLDW